MIRKIDVLFLLSLLGLLTFSLLFIYSSSLDFNGNVVSNEFIKQVFFIILGLVLFVIIHFIPLLFFEKYRYIFYWGVVILLVLTVLFGEERNGAKSWFGFFGFGIQVSEFMKVTTIIYLAAILSEKKPDLSLYRYKIAYSWIVVLPMVLVMLQPDLGTTLVFIPILLGVYFLYGVPAHRIFYIVGVGVASVGTLIVSYYIKSSDLRSSESPILLRSDSFLIYVATLFVIILLSLLGRRTGFFYQLFSIFSYIASLALTAAVLSFLATLVLKPYQIKRLLVFVNPEVDPLGSGWHILQSKAAIGSGGLLGQGYLNGSQSKLEFLPQKSTDFIFSMVGEELGFWGAGLVMLCYIVLIWRIIFIGIKSDDLFAMLYCGGIATMFFVHFTVNVGMTVGIMPITGIPLMLVSYGGSSLWASMIALAIVHNIYCNYFYKSTTTTSIL